jgi:hypothetical protein
MSKPSKSPARRTRRKPEPTPGFNALDELVIPVINEHIPEDAEEPVMEITPLDDGRTHLCAVLHHRHAIKVLVDTFDQERAYLRLSLECGHLHGDYPTDVLLLGNFLDPTPFHVRADIKLGMFGQLTAGCDLLVRADDEPVLRRTVRELLGLAYDLDWFFQLRLPNRLHWQETSQMEIGWEDLPHHDLDGFLDEAMQAPLDERTPVTLLRLAQARGRWSDVLRLLRDHRDLLPPSDFAPLKCLACRQLRRWLPAIRAAEEGGIKDGRYPGMKWPSPVYLHALIEAGDEIEALRILGKVAAPEPACYQWLRGLALHHAGDGKHAAAAFDDYFNRFPGDVLGGAITGMLDEKE